MEAWVNITFPKPDEQDFPEQQIFDVSKIFWNEDFPPFPQVKLPAFAEKEVCNLHDFDPAVTFGGSLALARRRPRTCSSSAATCTARQALPDLPRLPSPAAGGTNAGKACSPFRRRRCARPPPASTATGRDPQQALLYTNFVYNDPVVLRFDPPLLIDGSRRRGGPHLHLLRALRQRRDPTQRT